MPIPKQVRFKPTKVIVILMASAAIAVGLIGAGGYTVYSNMRHAQMERGWVDHSQLVLTNLQTQVQRVDRVDFNMQLYAATREHAELRSAVSTLATMSVSLLQLQELIKDNDSQTRHLQELDRDLQELTTAVSRAEGQGKVLLEKQILDCRNDLSILQQEERSILRQRNTVYTETSYESFVLTLAYLGLSLLIVMVLFIFLFRDARRQRADEAKLFIAKGELEATVHKLTERAEESSLLTSARDELQLCTTAKQAHESTVRHMELLLPGTSGATLIINNSRRMVEIAARWGTPVSLLDGFDPDACCGLRAGRARWRKQGKSELHCAHFTGEAPENYLCVPLAAHGETQGFVFISCDTTETLALAEERTPLVQELVELASLSIAALNLRAKLEGQSIRDGLTGLFNRHFMEIALEREIHRAARHKTPLAVMMLDVDHFKQFNDTFGHEAGDVVLREAADCFKKSVRAEDLVCRYGGEEFVVIMPDAGQEAATSRAEAIREALSGIRMHFHGELLRSITVSVGIAMYPESSDDGLSLIRLADNALYRAKSGGRNQVKLALAVPVS